MRISERLRVARLVLVGDRGQLRAVGAGEPFRALQDAGIPMAEMDEILRQRDPEHRRAVETLQQGRAAEAVRGAWRGARGAARGVGCGGGPALARARRGATQRNGDPRAHPLHPCRDPPRRARGAGPGGGAARPRNRDRALCEPAPDGGPEGGRPPPRVGRLRDLPLAGAAAGGWTRGMPAGSCAPRTGTCSSITPRGARSASGRATAGCATVSGSTRRRASGSGRATGSAGPGTTSGTASSTEGRR